MLLLLLLQLLHWASFSQKGKQWGGAGRQCSAVWSHSSGANWGAADQILPKLQLRSPGQSATLKLTMLRVYKPSEQTKLCRWGTQTQQEGMCQYTMKSLAEMGREPKAPDSCGLGSFCTLLCLFFCIYISRLSLQSSTDI